MTTASEGRRVSIGVQELIEKLRDQGVQSGQNKAEALLRDAETQAAQMIEEARTKAEAIISKAHEEAGFITRAGQESLEMAHRNAVLELREYLLGTFSERVGSLVGSSLESEDVLIKMILAVAGDHALQDEGNVEVILPRQVIGLDELKETPEQVRQGPLLEFLMGQAEKMLQKGVTFAVSKTDQSGVMFRLKDRDVEVELSDETVNTLLLKHLQPRFRALLEGIDK